MPNKKFEGGELGEGQGDRRFGTREDVHLDAVLEETASPTDERINITEAREIMGEDFYGPEEAARVFGVPVDSVPPIPFSRAELLDAKERKLHLVFFTNRIALGGQTIPLIFRALVVKFSDSFSSKKTDFRQFYFENEQIRTGWRLVTPGVLADSSNTPLLSQLERSVEHLENTVYVGRAVPEELQQAIEEFKRERPLIQEELNKEGGWRKALERTLALKLIPLISERAVETAYRYILLEEVRNRKFFTGLSVSTSSVWGENEHYVIVGRRRLGPGPSNGEITVTLGNIGERYDGIGFTVSLGVGAFSEE